MLESHTREIDTIDTTAMKRARKKWKKKKKKKKNNLEETKQKCRDGTAFNGTTGGGGGGGGGGLQLLCGRSTLALISALVPQTLSCLVCMEDS